MRGVAVDIEKGGVVIRKSWRRAKFVSPKDDTGRIPARDDEPTFEWSKLGLQRFWYSLPVSGKMLLVLSILEAGVILAYALVYALHATTHNEPVAPSRLPDEDGAGPGLLGLRETRVEETHVTMALGITAGFFCLFVLDALWNENGYELLAALLLAVAVCGRVVYFQVVLENPALDRDWVYFLSAVVIVWLLTAVLAALSFFSFGWRQYGRFVGDYRTKDAATRKRLFQCTAALRTLWKLDLQFLFVLTAIGVDITFEKRDRPWWLLFGINMGGLALGLGLALWAHHLAKHPRLLSRQIIYLDAAMALAFLQPLANIFIVATNPEQSRANATVSLFISCGLYMAARLANVVCLHVVLVLYESMETDGNDGTILQGYHRHLVPLMRGAWLGKPSASNPNKQRYFQLAQDKKKLRWSWRRYVWLVNADSLTGDHQALTITLSFTLDPDIRLQFRTVHSYAEWLLGLELLLVLLLAPTLPEDTDLARHPAARRALLQKVGFVVAEDDGCSRLCIHRERQLAAAAAIWVEPHPVQKDKRLYMAKVLEGLGMKRRLRPPPGPGLLPPSRHAPLLSADDTDYEGADDASEATTTATIKEQQPALSRWLSRLAGPKAAPEGPVGTLDSFAELGVVGGGAPGHPAAAQPPPAGGRPIAGSYSDVWMRINAERKGEPPPQAAEPERPAGQLPPLLAPKHAPPKKKYAATVDTDLTKTLSTELRSIVTVDVIDSSDLDMGAIIGKGAGGVVRAAWLGDAPVAVKEFAHVRGSLQELEMLQAAQGPHVVGLKALCYDEGTDRMQLVMELCPQDSLHKMLKDQRSKTQQWDIRKLLRIVRGIAAGLAHLHTQDPPILHRDLKPGNIFVVDSDTVKIGDFGQSRFVEYSLYDQPPGHGPTPMVKPLTPRQHGTLNYSAPDLLRDASLAPPRGVHEMLAIDIFAFGSTLWEVLNMRAPFVEVHPQVLKAKLLSSDMEFLHLPRPTFREADPFAAGILEQLADLVEQTRHFDPLQRPTALMILEMVESLCASANVPPYGGPSSYRTLST